VCVGWGGVERERERERDLKMLSWAVD